MPAGGYDRPSRGVNKTPARRPASQSRATMRSVWPVQPKPLGQKDSHLAARQRCIRAVIPAAAARRNARKVERFDVLEEGMGRRHIRKGLRGLRRDLALV